MLRHGRRVLLSVAILGATLGVAQAAPPRATPRPTPSPSAPSAVELPRVQAIPYYLDEWSLQEKVAKGDGLVRVTEAELAGLVSRYDVALRLQAERERRAAEPKASPTPSPTPPPVALPPVIRKLEFTGRVSAMTLAMTASIQVSVPGTSPTFVGLLPTTYGIAAARLPDVADRLYVPSGPEGQLTYLPVATGDRNLQLDVAIPITSDRAGRSVTLPLPGATDQHVELRLPAQASGITVTPDWVPHEETPLDSNGGIALKVRAGGLTKLTVAWIIHSARPAPAPAPAPSAASSAAPAAPEARRAPRIHATLSTLHAIGDEGVRFQSWIDVVNSGERINSLDLEVPRGVTVRRVAGPLVRRYEESVGESVRRLRLVLSEPFKGRTRLEVAGEAALSADEPLPLVAVPQARSIQGVIGVAAFSTYEISFDRERSKQMRTTERSELPGEVTAHSPSPVLGAYRYRAEAGSAVPSLYLHLKRFEALSRVATTVEEVNAITVLSPGQSSPSVVPGPKPTKAAASTAVVRTYTRVVFRVANAGAQELELTLPEGAQIQSCFVDLLPQSPARRESTTGPATYLIPLKRSSVDGGRLVPFPVEVAYRHDLPQPTGWVQRLDLPFFHLNAPMTSVTWTLFTPEGQRLVSVDGAFREMAPEQDLVLVTFGQSLFELVVISGGKLLALLCMGMGLLWLIRRGFSSESAVDPKDLPAKSRKFLGIGWVELFIVLMIIGVLAAISVPNFRSARERANTRACYANQKTISGAVEMYNLDKNTRRTDFGIRFFSDLKASGYLQSSPDDPGQGSGSGNNYEFTNDGNGIRCRAHGSIQ